MNLAKKIFLVSTIVGFSLNVYGANRVKGRIPDLGPDDTYLLITGVVSGQPADQLELKKGDMLRMYNNILISSKEQLAQAIAASADSVEVIVEREDQVLSFRFPPGSMGILVEERLPEVKFEKDAVMLEGIKQLDDSDGMSNSFILSLTRVANFLGDATDYATLMGLSGAGFRLQMQGKWDKTAVIASEGYRCDLAALDAMGYEYTEFILDSARTNMEQIRQAIIKAIDDGTPVLAFQLKNDPSWGIVTGYQKSGRDFIVRTYDTKHSGYTIATTFPNRVFIIHGRVDSPPTPREAAIQSFAHAQRILTTPSAGSYYCGTTAMDYWLQALETERFGELNTEDFDRTVEANYFMYKRLGEDRVFAADYLEKLAIEFPDVQEQLQEISHAYRTAAEDITGSMDEGFVPQLSQIVERSDWTPTMRNRQLAKLRLAQVQDEKSLRLWREVNEIYNPDLGVEEEIPEEEVPEEEVPGEETPDEETPEELPEGAL